MADEVQEKAERLRLVYRTETAGRPSDVELPFRVLVLGDFTRDARAGFEGGNKPLPVESGALGPILAKLAPKLKPPTGCIPTHSHILFSLVLI